MKEIIVDDNFLSSHDKNYIINKINKLEDLDIEILFKSDFSYTSKLRDFIAFMCDSLWIDSILKFKIILVVDELNNNAIEYWSLFWEYNKLRVIITFNDYDFKLVIEVEDTWKWKKHKTSNEMEQLWDRKLLDWFYNHSIRGRWLFLIVKNIVNRLYFKDTDVWWLVVWIEKNINYKKIDKK